MNASAVKADSAQTGLSAKTEETHNGRAKESPRQEAVPLVDLAQRMSLAGEHPSMEGLAGGLAAMPLAGRQSALRSLQRTRGNRFVQRLAIQAKLNVGAAGDRYEQEAERVADQVMRRIESPAHIQRKEDEEKDEIQAKPLAASITPLVQRLPTSTPLSQQLDEDEEEIQTKRISAAESFEAGDEFESRLSSTRGGGSPLPDSVRGQMERGFGADFSGVRLHAGSKATQLNREVSSQAFTHGHDIYLGEGKSDLQSAQGKRLLAHELTHVMQQVGSCGQKVLASRLGSEFIQRMKTLATWEDRNRAGKKVQVSLVELEASDGTPTDIGYLGASKDASYKQEGAIEALNTKVGPGGASGVDLGRLYIRTALSPLGTITSKTSFSHAAPRLDPDATYQKLKKAPSPLPPATTPLYWFYYILQQVPGDRKLGFVKEVLLNQDIPAIKHEFLTDPNKLRNKLLEMFRIGFISYEQLQEELKRSRNDPGLRLIKTGAELANKMEGVTGLGYGFRGDSRDPNTLRSSGGFTTKIAAGAQYKRDRGLDQPWNPFALPNDLPQRDTGYFRRDDADNDLTTIISVAFNFIESTKFPLLGQEGAEVEATADPTKPISRTWVYLVLVENCYDTALAQGKNSFPEIATRSVEWGNVLAAYRIRREHKSTDSNAGHKTFVEDCTILDGAKSRYENNPAVWPGLLKTVETYAGIQGYDYNPVKELKNPTSLRFRVKYHTDFGQNLFVVGGIPQLGSWNVRDAKPLNYAGPELWQGEIPVTDVIGNGRFEFKYIMNEGDKVTWEGGTNHVYEVQARNNPEQPDAWNFTPDIWHI